MNKTIGFIRTSVDTEDVSRQRDEIQEYGRLNDVDVTDFMEISTPERKCSRQKRVAELSRSLSPGDTLVIVELSKLGRSTGEVIYAINHLMKFGVTIVAVREKFVLRPDTEDKATNMMVSLIAMLADIEHKYSSSRTKEVLAAKKSIGVHLGKRKGTIQASMYDKDRQKIEELLNLGVSQRRIVTHHLGYGTANSLNHYIRTRGLQMHQHTALHGFVSTDSGMGVDNRG